LHTRKRAQRLLQRREVFVEIARRRGRYQRDMRRARIVIVIRWHAGGYPVEAIAACKRSSAFQAQKSPRHRYGKATRPPV
jgi:hypothetical protein